ncbi:MAG: SRPBCC family protein [Gammaproteobacteria bacterium]|nr:SRPBCC family protein [Gammaproteobacteria bacterium]MCP5199935.1 SRPBCC family protein [Gammaproteobacteria bacterium]
MRFSCSHQVVIAVPPAAVYDYLADPCRWPEWHPASHHIDAPGRPLARGERFDERWRIRRGEIHLRWQVTASDRPGFWAIVAETDFIGPIVGEYRFEAVPGGTRYTRTLVNPDRAEPPTPAQLAAIDDEARLCLANTRARLEAAVRHG